MVSAGAMLLDRLGPPGRCSGCWPHDGEVAGGAVADLGLLISGPRVTHCPHPYAREGADGQAVVCPLLRGRSPTRGVAPKQHRAPALAIVLTLTRARALMARPWSARCYGVARQREGSRQNSIGGSGVLSLRHFGLVLFILILSLGAWVPKKLARRSEGWFRRRAAARPARAAWIKIY